MDRQDEVLLSKLERRVKREKSARREAEAIAAGKIVELHQANSLLKTRVNEQAEELRLATLQHELGEEALDSSVLSEISDMLESGSSIEELVTPMLRRLQLTIPDGRCSLWRIERSGFATEIVVRDSSPDANLIPIQNMDLDSIGRATLEALGSNVRQGQMLLMAPGLSDTEQVETPARDAYPLASPPLQVSLMSDVHSRVILDGLGLSGVDLKVLGPQTFLLGVLMVTDDVVEILVVGSQALRTASSLRIVNLMRSTLILVKRHFAELALESRLVEESLRAKRGHDFLIESAKSLMAASVTDRPAVINSMLTKLGSLMGNVTIVNWHIDYLKDRYVSWDRSRHPQSNFFGETIDFGVGLLDDCRVANSIRQTPTHLAMARGIDSVGRPTMILQATSETAVVWDSVLELFEKTGGWLGAHEGYFEARERAEVALSATPWASSIWTSIDLQKPFTADNIALVEGNRSFYNLHGLEAGSFPEPNDLVYWNLSDVPKKWRDSAGWMFEEVERRLRDQRYGPQSEAATSNKNLVVGRCAGGTPRLLEIFWTSDYFVGVHNHRQEYAEDITDQLLRTRRRESERKARQIKAEYLANHDDLTGLFNRRGLLNQISQIASSDDLSYLAIFDLDRFKDLNGTIGHDFGDEFLKVIARRLLNSSRPEDAVGRLGGDEFVVAIRWQRDMAVVNEIVQEMVDSVSTVVEISGIRVYPSLSVGLSRGLQVGDLHSGLRQADLAMRKAKRSSESNIVSVFDDDLLTAVSQRRVLDQELRDALRRSELLVHYQPLVSMRTGLIIGAEALVRWGHPTRGLLSAGSFIEDAELLGLASSLSSFVLELACAEAATWPHQSGYKQVRVNLTADQVADKNLPTTIEYLLETAGLDPEGLCLEITETAIMKDPAKTRKVVDDLRRLGVAISLDDFGTGYSSLSHLKNLSVDSIKVDKSFVRDVERDQSSINFVTAIVGLAKGMDLGVVVEGIETEQEAKVFLDLNCDEAQGFYYHKPMPADKFRGLLESEQGMGAQP